MLSSLDSSFIEEQSFKASQSFVACDLYRHSDIILSYYAMPGEINPRFILESAVRDGKTVALPKTVSGTSQMDFYILGQSSDICFQLERGQWGIMEPKVEFCRKFSADDYKDKTIAMIVPGMAFTWSGKRLGHGKGFYDRYLEDKPQVCKIAFAFEEQIVDDIPIESTDILMDYVLTPIDMRKVF